MTRRGKLIASELTEQSIARFWMNVDRGADDECWAWTGGLLKAGYGRFHSQGAVARSHCLSYEMVNGPILDGVHLDHTCHNQAADCSGGSTCAHRRCVNPAHLAPATPVENVMRGKSQAAQNARKTHCWRGHKFDEMNSYVDGHGRRRCRACARINTANQRQRQKEERQ